jgi:cytidylate kinase
VAAERVYNDPRVSENKYESVAAVRKGIEGRVASDRERYSRYYGVDCYDPEKFDCIIDTTNLQPEQVIEKILEEINKRKSL